MRPQNGHAEEILKPLASVDMYQWESDFKRRSYISRYIRSKHNSKDQILHVAPIIKFNLSGTFSKTVPVAQG